MRATTATIVEDGHRSWRRAPPLLLACVLLAWGWQTGHLLPALMLMPFMEAWRWTALRWDLEEKDFYRISDYSSVLFGGMAIYQFGEHGLNGIYSILAWLPVMLLPLLVGQLYSTHGRVPLAALFISLRRQRKHPAASKASASVDLSYPYFLVCLIAATAGNLRHPAYFAVAVVLMAWALWPFKPRRYPAALWGALWMACAALGYLLQGGMQAAQNSLEEWVMQWVQDRAFAQPDPDRAYTAIGSIRRLKFSDSIKLRVRSAQPLSTPLLMREAAYDVFRYGTWHTQAPEFSVVENRIGGHAWGLADNHVRGQTLTANLQRQVELAIVPLPPGSLRLSGQAILEAQRNRYGAVKLESRPGYLDYQVEFTNGADPDPPPAAQDLEVPAAYDKDLSQVADSLDLAGKTPPQAITALQAFFHKNFTYSLTPPRGHRWGQSLAEFLLRNRSGHCEYFATSTVLLLRKAGVPARYVVGYSLQEYSPLEKSYIARIRDAHSWAQAYVDGHWQIVDTTPSVWREEEQQQASFFQPLSDLSAWFGYHFTRWREGEGSFRDKLPWAIPPLTLVLLWRLRRRGIANNRNPSPASRSPRPATGFDSELYQLLNYFRVRGLVPATGETLLSWSRSISRHIDLAAGSELRELLRLHYRYRFDPAGIDAKDRTALQQGVQTWLGTHGKSL